MMTIKKKRKFWHFKLDLKTFSPSKWILYKNSGKITLFLYVTQNIIHIQCSKNMHFVVHFENSKLCSLILYFSPWNINLVAGIHDRNLNVCDRTWQILSIKKIETKHNVCVSKKCLSTRMWFESSILDSLDWVCLPHI
jgi:hypothetical protein